MLEWIRQAWSSSEVAPLDIFPKKQNFLLADRVNDLSNIQNDTLGPGTLASPLIIYYYFMISIKTIALRISILRSLINIQASISR